MAFPLCYRGLRPLLEKAENGLPSLHDNKEKGRVPFSLLSWFATGRFASGGIEGNPMLSLPPP
jgi:hypothetical protein